MKCQNSKDSRRLKCWNGYIMCNPLIIFPTKALRIMSTGVVKPKWLLTITDKVKATDILDKPKPQG